MHGCSDNTVTTVAFFVLIAFMAWVNGRRY